MTRAVGIVADAVGAVIAAQVQRELTALGFPLPEGVARVIGASAVAAVRRDGWHISAVPCALTAPAPPVFKQASPRPPSEQEQP